MFAILCVMVCLAVLLIVVAGTVLLCGWAAWVVRRFVHLIPLHSLPDVLFFLRALPYLAALFLTLGFALPAFLKLEPQASGETPGPALVGLSAAGALLVACIGVRLVRILRRTSRIQQEWLNAGALQSPDGDGIPVYCLSNFSPLLVLTGVVRPKIFVAKEVVDVLSEAEFSAALAHELAHAGARDNLKRVLLNITQLPGQLRWFRQMDAAWIAASEIAADQAALSAGIPAVELASALVKVARMGNSSPTMPVMAASWLVPEEGISTMRLRLLRLDRALTQDPEPLRFGDERYTALFRVILGFSLITTYIALLNTVLPWVHEGLEWLVQ